MGEGVKRRVLQNKRKQKKKQQHSFFKSGVFAKP
jgi:hypothetical protein